MKRDLSDNSFWSQDLEFKVSCQDRTIFDHPLLIAPKLRFRLLFTRIVVVPLTCTYRQLIRTVTIRDHTEEHIHLLRLLQFHIIKSMLHATRALKVGMIIGELDAEELGGVRHDHLHSYPGATAAGHRHRK